MLNLEPIKARVKAYETALDTHKWIEKSRLDLERYAFTDLRVLITEVERMREKQTPKLVDISDDGEKFCPACDQEVVGYYSEYCEHCGQSLEYPDEEE